jgi:copper chaperone CopZ
MQTQTLNIAGLNSEQSAAELIHALQAIDGIADVSVSLLRRQADVRFDERQIDPASLRSILAQAGYTADTVNATGGGSCCGGCCS